jgi:hypothetical protein
VSQGGDAGNGLLGGRKSPGGLFMNSDGGHWGGGTDLDLLILTVIVVCRVMICRGDNISQQCG